MNDLCTAIMDPANLWIMDSGSKFWWIITGIVQHAINIRQFQLVIDQIEARRDLIAGQLCNLANCTSICDSQVLLITYQSEIELLEQIPNIDMKIHYRRVMNLVIKHIELKCMPFDQVTDIHISQDTAITQATAINNICGDIYRECNTRLNEIKREHKLRKDEIDRAHAIARATHA